LDLGMKRYENRHIFGVSECDESNFDQNWRISVKSYCQRFEERKVCFWGE
jgi:hypothetical protein